MVPPISGRPPSQVVMMPPACSMTGMMPPRVWATPSSAPEFFAEIERRTGFAPGELFFVDDKASNVEAAKARGWAAATWTWARTGWPI